MRSRTTAAFRRAFRSLPPDIQRRSRVAYRLFQADPRHPSLRFKKVHPRLPVYSVRISRDYRAVGVLRDEVIVWLFIGSHADYDAVLRSL